MNPISEKTRVRTRCPYTLKPLNEIKAASREHIILDALGGPNGYSVIACEIANNVLGQTIDSKFVNDPLVSMLRMQVGVESRSGQAKWKTDGTTVESGRSVQVTFSKDEIEIYHKKPVERFESEKGAGFHVIAHEPQSLQELEKIKKSMARKGLSLADVENNQEPVTTIHTKLTIDLNVIEAGLMKIAYLAAFEFLGDKFLDDPLNPEWQKIIRGGDAEFMKTIPLKRTLNPDLSTPPCSILLPKLESHQHGIMFSNLNNCGPVMMVQLFGSQLLTIFTIISDSGNFDLDEGEGKLVIIDVITGESTYEPWLNHLVRSSGNAI